MKTIKLPNTLTIALGQYFLARQLANTQEVGRTYKGGNTDPIIEYRPGKPWNKVACLERISKALPQGWCYQAIAGTFWFNRRGSKQTYKVDQNNWPLAKVIAPGESCL